MDYCTYFGTIAITMPNAAISSLKRDDIPRSCAA